MSKVYLTFEDMQNDPDADDTEATDIVLSANGFNGPIWWCPKHETWLPFKQFYLDLSPLQKFMGVQLDMRKAADTFVKMYEPQFGRSIRVAPRMYGMDYDFDWVPPAPSPEKSPQEKALDDFIAKRKAKREKQVEPGMVGQAPQSEHQWKTERALDRAMRRLSFHEQDIHTRLMPYRREE